MINDKMNKFGSFVNELNEKIEIYNYLGDFYK